MTNGWRPDRRGRGWGRSEARAARAGRLNSGGGGAECVCRCSPRRARSRPAPLQPRGAHPTAIMSDRKAVIKNADMSEEMQQDAVECATQALEKYNIEKDIAAHIKKEFDKKYNPTWHCIVGRNFGSYVTHETKHFIYFYLGQVAILLFKSG
ncbi:dynein light chain 1, cytoplasmic-like isoform X2 [Manacus candei]|uniref:dynein light chain 1, cytoplasmic-like isoform X2 n=1 Tax=Manacus candei TaxID=415023 RepID=UPI002227CF76|nr:dynein light chain 1, cytoplasmic-like isoform X2 [Manacus candei]